MGQMAVLRTTPALDDLVELPAGRCVLGEPGEEREVELARVLIGRYPVCHVQVHGPDAQLADHPATNVTLAQAEAFAAQHGARLPTSDTKEGETILSREQFMKEWSVDEIYEMVIEGSDTDMIAAQPLPLTDLFHDGLSPWEKCAEMAEKFISRQPRVFAETLGKMMWWCGEDKIIYGGESPIWHPQWALEAFWNFELPQDIVEERGYPQLTEQAKRKILGENLAKLHGIDVEAKKAELGVPG